VSRSPTESVPDSEVSDYRAAWTQLGAFMRRGRSLSGNERNCCFLNTRGTQFADVSSATGLDLIDDGRAVALVDWDHDGDQDLWLLNRTGPQVRFLRNDVASGNRFIDLRLVGDIASGTNRDAIGARLELHLGGEGARKRIKTLAAGDGFLGQSSKWLHFGLGRDEAIERLVVRWPGRGEAEVFTGLQADHRYRIVQGSGRAERWSPPPRRVALEPSTPEVPAPSARGRTLLLSPSPKLELEYVDLDGKPAQLPAGPILVNLWATWCAPCLEELKAMAAKQQALRAAGVTVLALNVEGASDTEGFDPARAKGILESMGFSFPAGLASPALLDELQRLADELLFRQSELPLPSSFLLDAERQIAVIYKGPVEVAQLVGDTRSLARRPTRIQEASTPFAGRWIVKLFHHDVPSIASVFLEAGDPERAINYVRGRVQADRRRPPGAERDRRLARSQVVLGNLHVLVGRAEEAGSAYEEALALVPEDAGLHLALAKLRNSQGRAVEAEEHVVKALAKQPNDAHALTLLGLLRLTSGNVAEAIEFLERAIEADPGQWPAANNLAWIRAAHPDSNLRNGAEAVRLATLACEATGYTKSDILDTLAVAQAETGRFAAALETVEKALTLLSDEDDAAAKPLQARRELYRAGRRYRDPDLGEVTRPGNTSKP